MHSKPEHQTENINEVRCKKDRITFSITFAVTALSQGALLAKAPAIRGVRPKNGCLSAVRTAVAKGPLEDPSQQLVSLATRVSN